MIVIIVGIIQMENLTVTHKLDQMTQKVLENEKFKI